MEVLPNILSPKVSEVATVTILQCTDLHHFEDESKDFIAPPPRNNVCKFSKDAYWSEHAIDLLDTVVRRVKPDLVVFTGDMIDGRRTPDPIPAMKRITQPLVSAGVPWALTPGNWDSGSEWGRAELLKALKMLPGCASQGASGFDHVLPVGPLEVFLFDSKGVPREHTLESGVLDNLVGEEQVEAFDTLQQERQREAEMKARDSMDKASEDASEGREAKKRKLEDVDELRASVGPSRVGLACFHIPLPELSKGRRVCGHEGQPPQLNCQGHPSQEHQDSRLPKPTLFQSLQRSQHPPIVATFSGHHHYNDLVTEYEGVWLCYGRVSGFTPPTDYEGSLRGPIPFQRGIRVIQYTVPKPPDVRATLSTWIEGFDGCEDKTFFQKELRV